MAFDLTYSQSLILVVCLFLLAIGCTMRGLQYGLLLILFAGLFSRLLLPGKGGLPDVTAERLVWPAVLLFFFLRRKRGEIARSSLNWIEYALLTLVIVILISTYFAGSYVKTWESDTWDPDATKLQLRPFLNGFFYPLLFCALARRAIQTDVQVRQFFIGIGLITVYLIITGLGEASSQHWLVFPKYILNPELGIHPEWVRGPFLAPSSYGLAVSMGLPIIVWLFFTEHRPSSWLWSVIAVLAVVPVIFTYQRAAWIGTAIALGASVLAWPKQRIILMGGLVLAASIGLLTVSNTPLLEKKLAARWSTQTTIDFRVRLIDASLKLIRTNLVTGIGFYQFRTEAEEITKTSAPSHNSFLTLFAELGLLGFIPYCSIFIFLLFRSMKIYLQRPQYRPLIMMMWGVTGTYLVALVTSDHRMNAYVNILFFALWGIVLKQIQTQLAFRKGGMTTHQPVISFV